MRRGRTDGGGNGGHGGNVGGPSDRIGEGAPGTRCHGQARYVARMASIFTKIINGELPGRFVYSDDQVVAFLTIAPLKPGHTLVVPRREVASWLELSEQELNALWSACRTVGRAIEAVYSPGRVAALLLGLEVPHVHVHLVPIDSEAEARFDRADPNPDQAEMDEAQRRIREALPA